MARLVLPQAEGKAAVMYFLSPAGVLMPDTSMCSDTAYTCGLLRHVGKVIVLHDMPDEFEQALHLSGNERIPLRHALSEVIGFDDADAYTDAVRGLESTMSTASSSTVLLGQPVVDSAVVYTSPEGASYLQVIEDAGALSPGAIIGIIVGGVAAAAALVLVCVCLVRRRRRNAGGKERLDGIEQA